MVQEALELDANIPGNEQRKEEGDQEQGDKQETGDEEKELQERDEVEEVCDETTEIFFLDKCNSHASVEISSRQIRRPLALLDNW